MSTMSLKSKLFALLACCTLLLSAYGCKTGSVVAPDSAPDRNIITDPTFISILSTPESKPFSYQMMTASDLVSAENGGSVSNGYVTLSFPPGALNADTEITVDMPEAGKYVFEFGPHGIQFNKPVIMTLDLSNTDAKGMGESTCTLWFNEETGYWEKVEKLDADSADETKSVLWHFSKFSGCVNG